MLYTVVLTRIVSGNEIGTLSEGLVTKETGPTINPRHFRPTDRRPTTPPRSSGPVVRVTDSAMFYGRSVLTETITELTRTVTLY